MSRMSRMSRQSLGAPPRSSAARAMGSLWSPIARTIFAVVASNVLIRAVAVRLVTVSPAFKPLQAGPVVFFSVVGVLGAVAAFATLRRLTRQPVRVYRASAVLVLALSVLPVLGLRHVSLAAARQGLGPASGPEVIILLVMHLATAAFCVSLAPTWTGRGR